MDEAGAETMKAQVEALKGQLEPARSDVDQIRRFRKEDVDRMREEMWGEFAPATELPSEKRTPNKRRTLSKRGRS